MAAAEPGTYLQNRNIDQYLQASSACAYAYTSMNPNLANPRTLVPACKSLPAAEAVSSEVAIPQQSSRVQVQVERRAMEERDIVAEWKAGPLWISHDVLESAAAHARLCSGRKQGKIEIEVGKSGTPSVLRSI